MSVRSLRSVPLINSSAKPVRVGSQIGRPRVLDYNVLSTESERAREGEKVGVVVGGGGGDREKRGTE